MNDLDDQRYKSIIIANHTGYGKHRADMIVTSVLV